MAGTTAGHLLAETADAFNSAVRPANVSWGRPGRRYRGGGGAPGGSGLWPGSWSGAGSRDLRGNLGRVLRRRVRWHTLPHIRSYRFNDRGHGGHSRRPCQQYRRGLHDSDHGGADSDHAGPAENRPLRHVHPVLGHIRIYDRRRGDNHTGTDPAIPRGTRRCGRDDRDAPQFLRGGRAL